MYSRLKIEEAKKYTHYIAFQPGRPKEACTVSKVRDEFVWVVTASAATPFRLNRVASGLLIAGQYRAE